MNGITSTVIPAGSSAATTQNSAPVDCTYIIAISGQAVLTGSPVGALTFQASNDMVQANQAPVNWTLIPNTSIAVAAAGMYLMPKIDACYSFVRIVYTPTSGTGTITANIKTIGL